MYKVQIVAAHNLKKKCNVDCYTTVHYDKPLKIVSKKNYGAKCVFNLSKKKYRT